MRVLPLVLLALFAVPAAAQAPTAREALGEALTKARETGALARVLGVRHMCLDDTDGAALVTLEAAMVDDDQAVRLAMSCVDTAGRGRGRERAMAFAYGFDGALRRFELSKGTKRLEGRMEDRTLVISGGPRERRYEWDDHAVPIEVALFFLSSLADQGLPERLVMRPFEGDSGHLEPLLTAIETLGDGQDQGWSVAVAPALPFVQGGEARVDARGALVEVVFGGKLRCVSIDATEVERLKALIAAPR